MNQDLEKAKSLLIGDITCAICRGEREYTTRLRGVKPLVSWLDEGLDVKNGSAADRVVGRATAWLYALLGVKEVYAHVMSTPAIQVLEAAGIAHSCGKEVPGIINRKGDGPCPFENAVMDISDAAEAEKAIRAKMKAMGIV